MQGLQLLDVIGPSDVFAEASCQSGRDNYSVEVVSTYGSPVRGHREWLSSRSPDDELGQFDTLLVAGDLLIQAHPLHDALLLWVKRMSERTGRFGSVCSGAFVLGDEVYWMARERRRTGPRQPNSRSAFLR
jgi:transcriptional regulator GlxA family with amidase domain